MTNLTGDRNGTLLEPGDPVMYLHGEETTLSATVVRVVGQQYLIQLDPSGPRATTEVTHLGGVMDNALAATSDFEIDGQEPFEVSGFRLEFRGDWGDEADLEAKTAQGGPQRGEGHPTGELRRPRGEKNSRPGPDRPGVLRKVTPFGDRRVHR